jgi:hypothetical protein
MGVLMALTAVQHSRLDIKAYRDFERSDRQCWMGFARIEEFDPACEILGLVAVEVAGLNR